MNAVRTILLASCLSLFSAPLFCANISVLIIETGLRDGKPMGGGEMTEIWETGLLSVFFEEGHIVTNAQAFALKKKPDKELTDEIRSYITEAEDAGIDYFILAYLNYERVVVNGGRSSSKLADIELNLFNIKPARGAARAVSKCIWTQNVNLRQGGYQNKEERTRVRKAARSLIARLGDTI